MDDDALHELVRFQFPRAGTSELLSKRYLPYVQMYRDLYSKYIFYKGFVRPDHITRAKIYRALQLCCDNRYNMKDIIVFTTIDGLIIKTLYAEDEEFTELFDIYFNQDEFYVFVPPGCDKLSREKYAYYRRALNNFIENEQLSCEIYKANEHDSIFLFVSLTSPRSLTQAWKEYMEGGVIRDLLITNNQLVAAIQIIPWYNRIGYEITSEDNIIIKVRSSSCQNFNKQREMIESHIRVELEYLQMENIITDIYEALGIIRALSGFKDKKIIPLPGTNRIYTEKDVQDIKDVLDNYMPDIERIPEGVEIFTQEEFVTMSKWKLASLIRTPSDKLYFALDLYKHLDLDPITREEFTNEFKASVREILDVELMTGINIEPGLPELIMLSSEPEANIKTVSFYIKIKNHTVAFWIIPDLSTTEYAVITLEAIRLLVIRWTDRSLFSSKLPGMCDIEMNMNGIDLHLIFSPQLLYIFEQTTKKLNSDIYTQDTKSQAQFLQEYIYLLQK